MPRSSARWSSAASRIMSDHSSPGQGGEAWHRGTPGMRAILVASCVMLTLTSHQTSADPYSIALAKYVAGHDDAASDALAHVQAKDIQQTIDTVLAEARSSAASILGDSALMFPVRRRLEAMAMLHTEYVLF